MRESLGCGRAEVTKEIIVGGDEIPLTSAESPLTRDSGESVGHEGEAQANTLQSLKRLKGLQILILGMSLMIGYYLK